MMAVVRCLEYPYSSAMALQKRAEAASQSDCQVPAEGEQTNTGRINGGGHQPMRNKERYDVSFGV